MEPPPIMLFPEKLTYRLPFASKARPVGPPPPKFETNGVGAPDGGIYLTIEPVPAVLIAKRLPAASKAIPAGVIPIAKFVCTPAGVILRITPLGGDPANRLPLLSKASQS